MTKVPTLISSDVHTIRKVSLQIVLIEIKNGICQWKTAFHWVSLM